MGDFILTEMTEAEYYRSEWRDWGHRILAWKKAGKSREWIEDWLWRAYMPLNSEDLDRMMALAKEGGNA